MTMPVDAIRARIVDEAMSWKGTPYHHHARVQGPRGGVDCLMLVVAVFEACGLIPDIDPGHYAHDWHLNHSDELYLDGLLQFARERPAGQAPLHGDVGLWKFGRTWSHGGIVVADGPQVLHSYVGLGVILTRLDEEPLAHRQVRWFNILQG